MIMNKKRRYLWSLKTTNEGVFGRSSTYVLPAFVNASVEALKNLFWLLSFYFLIQIMPLIDFGIRKNYEKSTFKTRRNS